MRRDWVTYLVHDLRGPLAAAAANLGYVEESLVVIDDEAGSALREARFELKRMGAMLQDLRDVDRISHGEIILKPAMLDLPRLLQQALAEIRPIARMRAITFAVEAVPAKVTADAALLERVLNNVLGNAVRYARTRIRVECLVVGTDAVVRISNDGPAVPVELRERIFEPFVQLHAGRTSGAGLGLAFCRMAIVAHGGRFELGSTPEGHVCFELRIRLAETASSACHRRLLVVEDEPSIQAIYRRLAASLGATVCVVGTLAEARARLGERFDCAIIDKHLPDGSGIDFIAELVARMPDCRTLLVRRSDHRRRARRPRRRRVPVHRQAIRCARPRHARRRGIRRVTEPWAKPRDVGDEAVRARLTRRRRAIRAICG